MPPVGVQQRCKENAVKTIGLQGPDAVLVEAMTGDRVDALDDIEQGDEGGHQDPAGDPLRTTRPLTTGGRRTWIVRSTAISRHAHSCPSSASSASSTLPA
ncbi:Uncharacterised protein [Mycobacteroides abscessus subsp. abscessus]|nr:Uncharacterised protein [Mycobacteroides abscessus subsp. abscessus]